MSRACALPFACTKTHVIRSLRAHIWSGKNREQCDASEGKRENERERERERKHVIRSLRAHICRGKEGEQCDASEGKRENERERKRESKREKKHVIRSLNAHIWMRDTAPQGTFVVCTRTRVMCSHIRSVTHPDLCPEEGLSALGHTSRAASGHISGCATLLRHMTY